ncbi:unnamed protein product [Rotaria sordida]|uniref:SCP domain-containing protein n=1 Tax=Rotaria sordida TaxID=392033 RepID=A0A814NQN0_9BILA|nr:unnamed protein product [Rotaria sordida]CAF1291162.1 unnamed protein product [Rotaria sordida]
MFTSGIPLKQVNHENDSELNTKVRHNDSLVNELLQSIDMFRRDNGDFPRHLNKREDFTSQQRQFQNEMLYAHNFYRSYYCAQPLTLDDELNRSAQRFAQKLADTNQFQHSGTPGVGENLYWASGIQINGYNAPIAWYQEIKDYNFNNGGFSMSTGHFTQLVWRNTKRLGVGVAYTNGGQSVYIVAQYIPPGNYQGQYQENVRQQGNC